jgi:mycofactocin precursor
MPETSQDLAQADAVAPAEEILAEESLVEESLVEEVSIDGMCGVY